MFRSILAGLTLLTAFLGPLARPLVAQADADLVQVARSAGSFSTLLAAVDAAGLTETLRGKGPFTLFAPTDAAFEKLPKGTVESLLKPENREKLKAILLYHVVPGAVPAATAKTLRSATTVGGKAVTIRASGATLMINDATVTGADVRASNGIIHVIDRVLLPPTAMGAGASRAGALLDLALDRGVPLFNQGEAGGCAAVYEVAVTASLALGDELPEDARRALSRGLHDAERQHAARDKAWTLRRAIDEARRLLGEARGEMASR